MYHKADEFTLWKQGSEQGVIQSPHHEHLVLFDMVCGLWLRSICLSRRKVSAMCRIFQIHVPALDTQHGTKCASLGN